MKKKILSVVLALSLAVAVCACGNNSTKPAAPQTSKDGIEENTEAPGQESIAEDAIVVKISSNSTKSSQTVKYLEEMAEAVNSECSDLVLEVYADSQLGSSADGVEAAVRGANICVVTDTSYLEDYVPDFAAMNGPYLYENYEDILKVCNSDWHKEMEAACSEKGIKVVANNYYTGFRYVMSNKEIRTPEDMKGVKVRIPQNTLWTETLTAMGGSPMGLDLSEVYSSISSGVIDAVELPLQNIWDSSLYEVCDYISETKHFTAFLGLYMSQEVWDSISVESQEIFEKYAYEYGIKCSEANEAMETEYRAMLEEKGVTFIPVDWDAFRDSCAVVYTKFDNWTPGLYERIQEILHE